MSIYILLCRKSSDIIIRLLYQNARIYMERTQKIKKETMTGTIIKFILPLMLTGILQLIYNAADSIVVGRFEGKNALAAVSSVGSLVNLLLNMFMGLAVGTAVAVAHDYGAKDYRGVERTVHTSILVSFIGGLIVGAVGCVFSRTFLVWMQSPETVLPLSTLYLRIYFLGTPANLVYNFGASILRSVGDTKKPLYFLTISGIANVVLNYIFVAFFSMGVAGVALATIISQYLSAIFVIVCLMKHRECIKLDIKKLKIHPEKLKKIVVVGIPAGFQGTVFSISNVLIQSSINPFGDVVMAGNGAAASLEGFTYTAMNSVYHAALTFVGQSVGAREYDNIKKIMIRCVIMVSVIGLVMGGLTYLFGDQLLEIYLPDDPDAIPHGILRLKYIIIPYFICGIMDVFVGGQRGLGLSVAPMINSILGACVFRVVWIYTVFAAHKTMQILYLSYPISWMLTGTAHLIFFLVQLRKIRKHAEITEAEHND